ncbi:MAG: alpha/beta fold hydrolase [Chloroflexi bacterium]|nr:alpha/beta fold hydrolase [Chloroflexota bacterium]
MTVPTVVQESIYLPILPGAGDLHVRVAGRKLAAPLLLFHGTGADVTWRTWEPQMAALGETRRVYALDWPGWGDSTGTRPEGLDRFAPGPMVAVALRAMDALDIPNADLGGVSWGGLIALELALAAPERVGKLLLVDAACRLEDVAAGRYAAVTQPIWLAWAEDDPVIPLSLGRALVAALPNCSLHLFPGRTHWPHHLHPEAFNEAAVKFLLEAGN